MMTSFDFEIAAKRRADREALHDAIFASISKKRDAEQAGAPISAPSKPAAFVQAATPTPPPRPKSTSADIEFEAARSAAEARQAAEREAKAAADFILQTRRLCRAN